MEVLKCLKKMEWVRLDRVREQAGGWVEAEEEEEWEVIFRAQARKVTAGVLSAA
jgi:hypothetical protein